MKSTKFILLTAMAVMAVSACNKEEVGQVEGNVAPHTLIASLESNADTKVAVNPETQKLLWNSGSEIRVFNLAGQNNVYQISNVEKGEFKLKSGQTAIEGPIHGFTLYQDHNCSFVSNTHIRVRIGTKFTDKANGHVFNMPLYGSLHEVNGQLTTTFKYMTGVLCLKFTNLPKETVSIILQSDKRISSNYDFRLTDDENNQVKEGMEITLMDASAEDQKEIEAVVADAASETTFDKTVYFPLVTGTHTKLNIYAKLADGTRVGLCSFNNKLVERAHIYTVKRDFSNLDPNAGKVSYFFNSSESINDWKSGQNNAYISYNSEKSCLKMDTNVSSTVDNNNKYTHRGDVILNKYPISFHAGNYPILAIRIDDVNDDTSVSSRAIKMDLTSVEKELVVDDNGDPDLKDGAEQYTPLYNGELGGNNSMVNNYDLSDGSNLWIYNFSATKFSKTGNYLTTEKTTQFNNFQIKYADIKTETQDPISYNLYWIQTFRTIDDAKAYIESEGLTITKTIK